MVVGREREREREKREKRERKTRGKEFLRGFRGYMRAKLLLLRRGAGTTGARIHCYITCYYGADGNNLFRQTPDAPRLTKYFSTAVSDGGGHRASPSSRRCCSLAGLDYEYEYEYEHTLWVFVFSCWEGWPTVIFFAVPHGLLGQIKGRAASCFPAGVCAWLIC